MHVKWSICWFSVWFELFSVHVQSCVKKVNDFLVRFNGDFKVVILEHITDLFFNSAFCNLWC